MLTVLVGLGLLAGAAPRAVAAADDAQSLYLADQQKNQQVRLAAGGSEFAPETTLPTATNVGAIGVVLDATGTTAYYMSKTSPASVQRVDVATGTVTGTVSLGLSLASFYGTPLALSPDGATLYTAGNGSVGVIDVTSFTLRAPIALGGEIRGVALSPDGSRLYATDHLNNKFFVVALPGRTVSTFTVSSDPYSIAVSPDGASVAVAFDTPSTTAQAAVRIVNADGSLRALVTPATLGSASGNGSTSVAFSPDGSVLYAITSATSNIVEIAPATGAVIRQVSTGTTNVNGFTSHLAVSSDGARVYLQTATSVLRYDAIGHVMGANLGPVGAQNVQISLAPDQAPTAAFFATPAPAGVPTSFDASASTAAAGTVALYTWDFGDGQTTTTTTPTLEHVYGGPGAFDVTLTVTSSGGTSTTVVYTGQMVSRNGGPTATTRQPVDILDAPEEIFAPDLSSYISAPGCGVPGALTFTNNPPTAEPNGYEFPGQGFRVFLDPPYSGVNTYTARIDPVEPGFDPAFPSGTTILGETVQILTVLPATGPQSTDPNAPCYVAPPPTPIAAPDLSTMVSPPTCTANGSLLFANNTPARDPNGYEFPGQGYRVYLASAYTGPGTYTATVEPVEPGFDPAFPNGTVITSGETVQTLTVLPAIGFQATDPAAPCYDRPTLPTVEVIEPPTQVTPVGTPASVTVDAVASDGEPVIFTATGLPPALVIDPATGIIRGILTTPGTYEVTTTACIVSLPTICDTDPFEWIVVQPTAAGGGGNGPLAATGGDQAAVGWVASAALLVGAGMIFAFRRRPVKRSLERAR
ncbi:PKD domain-containing protein [Rathayibacter sp. YIM 133350]|uniref:PKD domain-containing protein n=1 Tax=Rathayibacter sp. YIM 133350 TaxID=3131992 RepID=UPI00307D7A8B